MTAFLDAMPESVGAQRDLLRRLVATLGPDPTWRWLELSCSLARGAGDELSDIDIGIGVLDEDWPAALDRVDDLVRGLGEVVDVLRHKLGPFGTDHLRVFVQYADGVQLDLVLMPASARPGLPPNAVALLDKDGRLATRFTPASLSADPDLVHEWTFLGWAALADLDKYTRRGSCWEAHQRLEEARGQVWRLWAARHGVEYPVFGLTSVLDAEIPPPAGIEATVAGLTRAELRAAAVTLGDLLGELGPELAFGRYVAGRLREAP